MSYSRDDKTAGAVEMTKTVWIGCAGWSIPTQLADRFPATGTHLERYASRFNAVEINSSFYRPHQMKTYSRWADSTPVDFRFSVKLPREITHRRRLVDVEHELQVFLDQSSGLGEKFGVLLIQFPPSLKFDFATTEHFFKALRSRTQVSVACEPRHVDWYSPEAVQLFEDYQISRVVADPAPVRLASVPAGARELCYFRLHGSPRIYYSQYEEPRLLEFARRLIAYRTDETAAWCIFDNTADGFAVTDATAFREHITVLN
jgi:uncharacterized protein YecE (DUF72 family)